MGNLFSTNNSTEESYNTTNTTSLISHIDKIATNYILTQSMMDMLRFADKEYYENMIILTAYILKNQLTSLDLGIIKHRVMNGYEDSNNNNLNDSVYVSNTNRLKEITLNNEKKKEKALLLVSKFYIKIMSIFSAITATIDPQYVYEDENGEKRFFFLKDYDSYAKLDPYTKKLRISQLDNPIAFIQKRLAILKNKMNPANNNTNNEFMVINPGEKLCEMSSQSIYDEIGIKELDALYYDVYDYTEHKWNQRSETMQEKYEEDLLKFYQIFTGKKDKPDSIQSFADVESLDFNNLKRCVNRDYFEDLMVSKNDSLFLHYIDKIEKIQSITKAYKQKLLFILKQIFIPSETNHETAFVISSKLNMESLLHYQDEVKNIINQIYMNCERLFIEALVLYEKMYEKQHGELTENKIRNINESIQKGELNVLDETSFTPSPQEATDIEKPPILFPPNVPEVSKSPEAFVPLSSVVPTEMPIIPSIQTAASPPEVFVETPQMPVMAPPVEPPKSDALLAETPISPALPTVTTSPQVFESPVTSNVSVVPIQTPPEQQTQLKNSVEEGSPVALDVVAETPLVSSESPPVNSPGEQNPPQGDDIAVQAPSQAINSFGMPVSSSDAPPTNDAGIAQPPTNDADIAQPPTNDADIAQPPTNDAGIAQPPTNDAGIAQPPTNDAGIAQPPTNDADIAQPQTNDTGIAQPQMNIAGAQSVSQNTVAQPQQMNAGVPSVEQLSSMPSNNIQLVQKGNSLSILPVNNVQEEVSNTEIIPNQLATQNKLKVESPKEEKSSILDGISRMLGVSS